MSQDKKNTSSNKKSKTPKFNFYWIYGIIFVLIIGYQFFNSSNSTKKLNQNEFREILKEGDLDKIVIINKDIANIFLTAEALNKEKHKKRKSSLYSPNAPFYFYDFGDLSNFENELEKAKEDYESDFIVDYDTDSNFLDQIFIYLPFIFLIGLWIYFMRRMSGGAGVVAVKFSV